MTQKLHQNVRSLCKKFSYQSFGSGESKMIESNIYKVLEYSERVPVQNLWSFKLSKINHKSLEYS